MQIRCFLSKPDLKELAQMYPGLLELLELLLQQLLELLLLLQTYY
jgi:hypothetical protein